MTLHLSILAAFLASTTAPAGNPSGKLAPRVGMPSGTDAGTVKNFAVMYPSKTPTTQRRPAFAVSAEPTANCVVGLNFWRALSQIESGDNDLAHGRARELSRFQILPREWRRATAQPLRMATNAAIALAVARGIMADRVAKLGHEPSPVEFYELWNAPAQVGHPSRAVRERAERFENLVNKYNQKTK